MELRPLQALGGVGGIHLFNNQGIFIMRDIQLTENHLLYAACRMRTGTRSGKGVLIDRAISPHTLRSQIQNILGAASEGSTILFLVDAGIVGAFQGIVDRHQFLSAGNHRITHTPLLIPPDDSLDPCVHVPGVSRIPNGVYAQCLGSVCKYTGRMGVVISHHHRYRGIGEGRFMSPGLADEGLAHTAALRTAKASNRLTAAGIKHLMQRTASQCGRLIGHTGHPKAVQLNCVSNRHGLGREQPRDAEQCQQQGCHPDVERISMFLHSEESSFF